MYYINYKDGFVAANKVGGLGYPTRFVRKAMPFQSWDAADSFAKSVGLTEYAILSTYARV